MESKNATPPRKSFSRKCKHRVRFANTRCHALLEVAKRMVIVNVSQHIFSVTELRFLIPILHVQRCQYDGLCFFVKFFCWQGEKGVGDCH